MEYLRTLHHCSSRALVLQQRRLSFTGYEPQQRYYFIRKLSAITAFQVKERLDKGDKITVIDVRTPDEYAAGHIPGSLLIPFDEIKVKSDQLPQNKNTEIVVYCRSGRRSAIAADTLISLGYAKIYDLGAVSSWTYGLEK